MEIREFENLILAELKKVVDSIVEDNPELQISAKARAGAEISDWMEEQFVRYTQNHEYFEQSEASPKGKTKNPWDARTVFKLNDVKEEIWIDFKAIKVSGDDSNPDAGTPNKILRFIINGHFYYTFIYLFYAEKGNGMEFVKRDGNYSKLYFLKDINSKVRRNPKNQLQVDYSLPSEYRTREDFIKLLMRKLKEGHLRQIEISNKVLKGIDETESTLIQANKASEQELIKRLL